MCAEELWRTWKLLGISWQGAGVGLKEFGLLDSHLGFNLAEVFL